MRNACKSALATTFNSFSNSVEVAAWSETLAYEVMCTIGKRVTRIYVRGGRPVKLTTLVGERTEWANQAADHFRMRAAALAAVRKG